VAETLAFDYWRSNGVEIRVVRIFNTYGPRMALDDGRVVSNFVSQALLGQNLTIYGDGKQTRSFQFISDLISGMVKMMDSKTPKCHQQLVNQSLGTRCPLLVKRLQGMAN